MGQAPSLASPSAVAQQHNVSFLKQAPDKELTNLRAVHDGGVDREVVGVNIDQPGGVLRGQRHQPCCSLCIPTGLAMAPGSTLIPGAVTVTVMSWEAPSHPRQ
jgi:hypothetical protein